MTIKNTRIVLASRPRGLPAPENYRVEKTPLAELGKGQVLIKVLYLSLDPYMRGRMSAEKCAETRTPFHIFGALKPPPWHRFFLVFNYLSEYGEANRKLVEWVSNGQLKYRETIVEGLENAPKYFNWLFEGRNFGKLVVRVATIKA